jgi:phosphoribosylformylglycinamidine synthase
MSSIAVLPGSAALSIFALEKIQQTNPEVVYAEFVHLVCANTTLSPEHMFKAQQLLTYGPKQELPQAAGKFAGTAVPRLGTISPWSSKASDIFSLSGISDVTRVERGTRWFVREDFDLNSLDYSLLYDRMTQDYFVSEDFAALFVTADPTPLTLIPLQSQGAAALVRADQRLGLALSTDELDYLELAYAQLDRDPTDVELMMFAQANSEHCRHKIFNADWLVDGEAQGSSLFAKIRNTYKQINGRGVLSAYSDNAAVIEGPEVDKILVDPSTKIYTYIKEPAHILMKVETHNHPTAIAPFSGAATGSGGEIRDEGAVGRGSKPKAGMTGFTTSHLNIPNMPQPWEIRTGKPDHIVSALDIMLDGPIGAASFNNEFGRPAINGYFRTFEFADPTKPNVIRGYHKPVMVAGGVGSVRQAHVHAQTFPEGAALVVLGGPAMLIGLGGSAASSMASGSSSSDLDFASVQRGNPEMERRCQEVIDACCALGADNPILLIHDVGAGGLSNALPELIDDAQTGGRIELRNVLNSDLGMSPLEIWCNEAQERYVLGIEASELEQFEAICNRERCPYAVVGASVSGGELLVQDSHFDNTPVDLPLSVLLGKAPKMTRSFIPEPLALRPLDLDGVELADAIDRVLQFPAVASKQFLITIGDRSITGLVATQPMIGPWQVPVADVAVTLSGFNTHQGEAFAMGERSPLALIDPKAAARIAVAESLTNIVSADIDSLERVVLSANWMAAAGANAEDQALFEAVTAIGEEMCPALGIAIPVGKDSLSMQTRWQEGETEKSVVSPVTLIVSAFAPVKDVRRTLTPELIDDPSSFLVLLDLGDKQRLGGSCLAQVYAQIGDTAPNVEDVGAFRSLLQLIIQGKRAGTFLSLHDRSDGGLLACLLEMSFAGRLGLDIDIDKDQDLLETLFNEEIGFVVQVSEQQYRQLKAQAPGRCTPVARLRRDDRVVINQGVRVVADYTRGELQRSWAKTSYTMQKMRDSSACAEEEYASISMSRKEDPGLSAKLTFEPSEIPNVGTGTRPKLAVLREQGVNGQIEMAAAFDRAGFESVDVHMSDLISGKFSLGQFQTLVACGGFSYGDVLGGGGGWAKSALFNNQVRDQFEAFFTSDKLALGVCNGCQMMAQMQDLIPEAEHWPRFVRNRSEQFEGRTVMVKINAVQTPWLEGMQGSVMPVAIAHGEGRAEFSQEADLQNLKKNRQLAIQYVNAKHEIANLYPDNPNGAVQGLAGLTAAQGRVLIMMPHPERVFRTVQNVHKDDAWGEDGPWMRLFRNALV